MGGEQPLRAGGVQGGRWPAQPQNRALFHKGKALEKLNKTDDALEAYYDIISTPDTAARVTSPAEQIWFYRAGFEAISILEAAEKWRAAISIADRLANASGPRATEAKDRAERLRLGIVLAAAVLASVLLSLFLARTIVQPLQRLARAAVRVRLGRAREVTVPRLPERHRRPRR